MTTNELLLTDEEVRINDIIRCNASIAEGPEPAWRTRERERLKLSIANDTDERSGVLYWKSNGAVVPPEVFRDAGLEASDVQVAARKREGEAFAAEYRRMQPAQPSDEELAEMRAAFGTGVEVVDVISGRRTRL
jgi:hypothetical protein